MAADAAPPEPAAPPDEPPWRVAAARSAEAAAAAGEAVARIVEGAANAAMIRWIDREAAPDYAARAAVLEAFRAVEVVTMTRETVPARVHPEGHPARRRAAEQARALSRPRQRAERALEPALRGARPQGAVATAGQIRRMMYIEPGAADGAWEAEEEPSPASIDVLAPGAIASRTKDTTQAHRREVKRQEDERKKQEEAARRRKAAQRRRRAGKRTALSPREQTPPDAATSPDPRTGTAKLHLTPVALKGPAAPNEWDDAGSGRGGSLDGAQLGPTGASPDHREGATAVRCARSGRQPAAAGAHFPPLTHSFVP